MIAESSAIFIKLGGSLITDKTRALTARPKIIAQICQEFAALYHAQPDQRWFIGNGAGSFGHYKVHETGWRDNPKDSLAIARIRQATAELNRLIVDELLKHGIPALTMAPAAFSTSSDNAYQTTAQALIKYAQLGAVPIVYGDVICTDDGSSRIMSTEDVLDELAKAWTAAGGSVTQVIYCASVDGVLDGAGQTITSLTPDAVDGHIKGADGFDVTGGMVQKVAAGFRAATYTDSVHIINGSIDGQLTDCINGAPVGTCLRLQSA